MAKGGRKQTSDRVSSIAGKYVGDNSPLGDVSDADRERLPRMRRSAERSRRTGAYEPPGSSYRAGPDDLRTLAASCLSQDETPGGAHVETGLGEPAAE
jgi:hypothetical protein